MTFYVKYRRSDGQEVLAGSTNSIGEALAQRDEQHDVVETFGDARVRREIEIGGQLREVEFVDRAVVQATFQAKIDAEAVERMADPLAGVHAVKEAEARGAGARPLIEAEAAATGQDPEAIVQAIITNADARREAAAAIDLKRIVAKRAVAAATSIPAMIAASNVDWDAA